VTSTNTTRRELRHHIHDRKVWALGSKKLAEARGHVLSFTTDGKQAQEVITYSFYWCMRPGTRPDKNLGG